MPPSTPLPPLPAPRGSPSARTSFAIHRGILVEMSEQPNPSGGAESPTNNEGGINNDPPAPRRASSRIRMARANLVSPAALFNIIRRGGGDVRRDLDPEDPFLRVEEAGDGGDDASLLGDVDAADEDAPQDAGADAPAQAAPAAEAAGDPPAPDDEGAAGGDGGFSSTNLCYISTAGGVPPADGVTFMNAEQAFERSAIYRHIATLGTGPAFRSVFHPTTREEIGRQLALAEVRPLSDERRAACAQERRRLGLPVDDPDPINDADDERYQAMIASVNNRCVCTYDVCFCFH